ncbi:hypothetical protein EYZ11_008165 [Aspergillus tanneri]|uniref:Uncharacterized protein n=1 Tax=Aspergillus tanneri TaxID=1220188 RepID=A0A4S3JBK5_9EURO|nr:uncharacterized protein ATNIH1004_009164 [Aspergillus tanneri]KAA8644953.1 hypothetical protein ATNIH1004_009164 [Aspergillus tanneri]THC92375.1 hypothetical protein EYZ11_008165 [Aspergillus tanneri]
MDNPSYLRGCAEENHYESLQRHFAMPLRIQPASTDTACVFEFLDLFHQRRVRQLTQLTPDDCRLFCWKDCAIYSKNKLPLSDSLSLLDNIYREWFPHRAADNDVSDGSFFAKYMYFAQDTAGTLQDILHFHQVLCEKLRELEREMPPTLPINPCHVFVGQPKPRVAEYKLRESFSLVFIVLDAGWQEQGVLLVWRSQDDALKYNCNEDREITGYNNGGNLGQACVFRCPLKRAMQLIVSTDPERAKQQVEYNEVFEENLGEVNDGEQKEHLQTI